MVAGSVFLAPTAAFVVILYPIAQNYGVVGLLLATLMSGVLLAALSRQSCRLVLYMDGVPVLDAGGLSALNKLVASCREANTQIVIADLQFQPLRTLARAGVQPEPGVSQFYPTLASALEAAASGSLQNLR